MRGKVRARRLSACRVVVTSASVAGMIPYLLSGSVSAPWSCFRNEAVQSSSSFRDRSTRMCRPAALMVKNRESARSEVGGRRAYGAAAEQC